MNRGEGGRTLLQLSIEQERTQAAWEFDRARYATVATLIALVGLVAGLPLLFGPDATEFLAFHLAFKQDLPLAMIWAAALLLRPRADDHPHRAPDDRMALLWSMLIVVGVGWAGNTILFDSVPLSRDEQMAIFDQQIFARGAAFWPIEPSWRDFADALGRRFMLPIGANEYWVSAYLPVHAGFRALLGFVGDPALTSPLFAGLAAFCTWGIARRLWPDTPKVAIVGLILLVTSSQVLITSATAFSMSMHLGLNLLWLWLFLKNRWRTHMLAVLVGFLATGIHQPLFHPLFALPFCGLLLARRQWAFAAFYAGAYALIAACWIAYPLWIVSHGVAPAIPIDCATNNCASGVGYFERLRTTLTAIGPLNAWLTASNLLRFLVWQNPLLIPLAVLGAIGCWRSEPLVKALVISFLLPIVLMAIILPWQGHGWGYRYVHPVYGNAVLLACYGYHILQERGLSVRRPLVIASALAMVLMAVHGFMAAQLVKPFAQVRDQLAAIPADVVIVDTDEVPFGQDVVVNRPDLANRPKLLIASLVKPEDLRQLCSMGTIGFFDGPQMAGLSRQFGQRPPAAPSAVARALHMEAEKANCRTVR